MSSFGDNWNPVIGIAASHFHRVLRDFIIRSYPPHNWPPPGPIEAHWSWVISLSHRLLFVAHLHCYGRHPMIIF